MATTEQLQTWLTEAEAARHKLATGSQTASVKSGDREVTYSKADLDKLSSYIAGLQSQLSSALNTPETQRRPIHLTF